MLELFHILRTRGPRQWDTWSLFFVNTCSRRFGDAGFCHILLGMRTRFPSELTLTHTTSYTCTSDGLLLVVVVVVVVVVLLLLLLLFLFLFLFLSLFLLFFLVVVVVVVVVDMEECGFFKDNLKWRQWRPGLGRPRAMKDGKETSKSWINEKLNKFLQSSKTGWWQLKDFLIFTPKIGEDDFHFDVRIFFRWVGEKPPTRTNLLKPEVLPLVTVRCVQRI